MTLLNCEMKRMRTSLIVWTAAIALLIMVCLIIFPDMEDQVDELNAAFSSMGGFTAAFGMDRLNFGELMGVLRTGVRQYTRHRRRFLRRLHRSDSAL